MLVSAKTYRASSKGNSNMFDTRSRGRCRRFLAGTQHALVTLVIGLVPLGVGASPLVFIFWLMQPNVQDAREVGTPMRCWQPASNHTPAP
jgi:hypothetical protein